MKRVMWAFVVGLMFSSVAHADLLDIFKKAEVKMNADIQAKAEAPASLEINGTTVATSAATLINFLGAREGFGYDWKAKEIVNVLGATIATAWNTSLNLDAYNTDGIGVGLTYNLGSILPVENVPVVKYLKYLYVGASIGARDKDKWEVAPVFPDAQLKFQF